ncbi:MAG: glycosyltransferase family 2 protein [Aminipila sp.]
MDSEITVVIPSYNPGKLLIEALESVYNQTYSNWKLILVDDASDDNSLELAEKLLNDPRITVIRNDINLGQSQAQNKALDLVDTEYFVQLDSDDWFLPHALETLLNEFKQQPQDIAVVSGNMKVVIQTTEYLLSHKNKAAERILKGRTFKDRYDFLLSNKSLWPRCYRTSAVRDVGGWPTDDPYRGRNMEDRMILLRLIEKYRFHWIDEVLYVHRRHDYNNTHKLAEYNYIIEWYTRSMLKRWGDEYRPFFRVNDSGWKELVALKPRIK